MKTIKELEKELKEFDYTYIFSDDFSVWATWNKKHEKLQQEINQLKKQNSKEIKKLVEKYQEEYGIRFNSV